MGIVKPPLIIAVLISFLGSAQAQEKHTVSGTIKEKRSGEVLIGASIHLLGQPRSGSLSNAYGFYSVTAPAGRYTLIISFSGYQQDSMEIVLDKDISRMQTEDQKIITNMNIKTIHEQLPAAIFVMISKSYIINVGQISSFDNNTVFIGKHEIPIGDTYRNYFFTRFVTKKLLSK